MEFVLVPVPAEHVMAVMQYIVRAVSRAAAKEWDAEGILELWNDGDEAIRTFLIELATIAAAGGELEAGDAADRVRVSVREVAAMVNELNNVSRETDRPQMVSARVAFVDMPDGSSAETRMLQMRAELAELVCAALEGLSAETSDLSNG